MIKKFIEEYNIAAHGSYYSAKKPLAKYKLKDSAGKKQTVRVFTDDKIHFPGVAAVVKERNKSEYIILSDKYRKLSRNGKYFAIAHEIGHVYNRDLKEGRGAVRDIVTEINADKFGSLVVGKKNAIKALKEVKKFPVEGGDLIDWMISRHELNLRIRALKKDR